MPRGTKPKTPRQVENFVHAGAVAQVLVRMEAALPVRLYGNPRRFTHPLDFAFPPPPGPSILDCEFRIWIGCFYRQSSAAGVSQFSRT